MCLTISELVLTCGIDFGRLRFGRKDERSNRREELQRLDHLEEYLTHCGAFSLDELNSEMALITLIPKLISAYT